MGDGMSDYKVDYGESSSEKGQAEYCNAGPERNIPIEELRAVIAENETVASPSQPDPAISFDEMVQELDAFTYSAQSLQADEREQQIAIIIRKHFPAPDPSADRPDLSVRGTEAERANHQLQVLEEWRTPKEVMPNESTIVTTDVTGSQPSGERVGESDRTADREAFEEWLLLPETANFTDDEITFGAYQAGLKRGRGGL